jgi:four helix bundle protein
MSDYRDLAFYQKAREVIKGINDLIKTWPKTMQAQEISRQLLRSAMSIGANIAEGHGRHEGAEYIHYLIIAQGSANE